MGEAGIVYRLELWFSYAVAKRQYQGSYSEQFPYRSEAEHMLVSLKEGPLLVRYNPAVPSDYFIDPYRDVHSNCV